VRWGESGFGCFRFGPRVGLQTSPRRHQQTLIHEAWSIMIHNFGVSRSPQMNPHIVSSGEAEPPDCQRLRKLSEEVCQGRAPCTCHSSRVQDKRLTFISCPLSIFPSLAISPHHNIPSHWGLGHVATRDGVRKQVAQRRGAISLQVVVHHSSCVC
jgi:hypothetical protein